ncbi:unnamed protein product [Ixodes hexagonus]
MSRPSSTVCLKGPISTSRISSVWARKTQEYSLGSREGSRSLTSSGRLWAAELSASSATRRTPRSGSPRASRNGDSRAPSTWEPSAQRDGVPHLRTVAALTRALCECPLGGGHHGGPCEWRGGGQASLQAREQLLWPGEGQAPQALRHHVAGTLLGALPVLH